MIIAHDLPGHLVAVVEAYAKDNGQQVMLSQSFDVQSVFSMFAGGRASALIAYYTPENAPLIGTAQFKKIPVIICADMSVPEDLGSKAEAIIFLNQEIPALKKALERLKLDH